jgi:hypothetical protein
VRHDKHNEERQFLRAVSVVAEVIELFASAARRLSALTSKDWLKRVGTLPSMTLAHRSVERYQLNLCLRNIKLLSATPKSYTKKYA